MEKNAEGKNEFWFGYKGYLSVGTSSQYILQSCNLNDRKATIALLKGIDQRLPLPAVHYETLDASYDFEPIYEQIHRMGQQSVIAYNKR